MPQLHHDSLSLYEMFYDVRKALSETSAGFWSDLEIYNKLNQAQLHIATKAKCLKKEVTITTIASTQEYDLKDNSFSDILDIAEDGVSFKSNGTSYIRLTPKSKKQLARENPGWQGVAAGVPQYYYWDKTSKIIGLYPKPNSSNAGAYLFVSGYYKPKVLIAGTASSGSTTTLVMPAGTSTLQYPSATDDYYNGLWLEIYSGTGAGQKVEITDYTASSRTLAASFTTAPDSSSIFGIIPEIDSSAHYLMPLFALWKLWPKGGSRTMLGANYKNEYYQGLSEFIGEFVDDADEDLIRESYR
jgi:hypothetical protein